MALRSNSLTPASEPKITNPDEVQEAIRSLRVSKALGPNGIPNRSLKHLPQREVSLLSQIFNAVLRNHLFPHMWKLAREISILKPGKDPAFPSSYWPISLIALHLRRSNVGRTVVIALRLNYHQRFPLSTGDQLNSLRDRAAIYLRPTQRNSLRICRPASSENRTLEAKSDRRTLITEFQPQLITHYCTAFTILINNITRVLL